MLNNIVRQSIQPFNTFGIDLNCDILSITSMDQLINFLGSNTRSFYVLGGGSNVLFHQSFDELILKNEIKGIDIIKEDATNVYLEVASGENWNEFVLWALEHDFYGIENLSLIPGTVGAAPMQNIGAYGVELKDVLTHVQYYDYKTSSIKTIDAKDCELGYRDSIFKKKLKDNCFITKVGLKLHKQAHVNSSYGAINTKLEQWDIKNPKPKDISNAVIEIRQSKLPDPKLIGNAGSFFKNVMVSPRQMAELKSFYPMIPHYPTDSNDIKIPTAWLIDQCGWKGKKLDNVGTHVNHALVLVNYGGAQGQDIMNLAKDIQQSVWEKFSIEINPEVNYVY